MNAAKRREIFARLAAADPEPASELEYATPYQLLVAVILSAQATLAERIKTSGLYRSKAKNVIAMSRLLIERHGGEVPDQRAALEALPGVGRKTANVVLNIVFHEPTIAVDTHIFRVANRTGLATGKDPRAVEEKLLRFVPPEYRLHAHHWLILHGRYLCKARRPECQRCPIRDPRRRCAWPSSAPTANARAASCCSSAPHSPATPRPR